LRHSATAGITAKNGNNSEELVLQPAVQLLDAQRMMGLRSLLGDVMIGTFFICHAL